MHVQLVKFFAIVFRCRNSLPLQEAGGKSEFCEQCFFYHVENYKKKDTGSACKACDIVACAVIMYEKEKQG